MNQKIIRLADGNKSYMHVLVQTGPAILNKKYMYICNVMYQILKKTDS